MSRAYIDLLEKQIKFRDDEIERLKKRLGEAQLAYLAVEEKNKKLNNIISEAIIYNEELCQIYDCGMELRNAETNLLILKRNIKDLKGSDKE